MSLEQQNLDRYRMALEPRLVPVLLGVTGLIGLFAGLSAAARWQTWLLWRNATPFGVADAQFGRDVGYFAFTYPFQRFVLGFLFAVVVLSILAAALTHYLFGAIRLQTPGEKVTAPRRRTCRCWSGCSCCSRRWRTSWTVTAWCSARAGSSPARPTPTSTRCCRRRRSWRSSR